MKTLYKILFSAIILVAISESVKAQDIEGIDLWDKVTKEQIIAKFGQPKNYKSELMDDMKTYHELFYYDGLFLETEGSILTAFGSSNPSYNVLTKYIKKGIRVGDTIEKLSELKPVNKWTQTLDNGVIQYRFVYENEDDISVNVRNGRIVSISAMADTL